MDQVISADEKRAQVVNQCRAVAHMATALASISSDYAGLFITAAHDNIIEQVGKRTAEQMEILGNILNGIDAVDSKADEWMTPIFESAHRFWPGEGAEAGSRRTNSLDAATPGGMGEK